MFGEWGLGSRGGPSPRTRSTCLPVHDSPTQCLQGGPDLREGPGSRMERWIWAGPLSSLSSQHYTLLWFLVTASNYLVQSVNRDYLLTVSLVRLGVANPWLSSSLLIPGAGLMPAIISCWMNGRIYSTGISLITKSLLHSTQHIVDPQ